MASYDITSVGNALMDVLVEARDEDITGLELQKGIMHLVDADRQKHVLSYLVDNAKSGQTTELGGSAMNAIRTLAALGRSTVFAGMVKDDEFGNKIESRMKELGIKSNLGKTDEPTGSCIVLVTPDGERTMNTHLGASRLYTKAEVPHDEIASSKIFHFTGYQWDTDGQKEAIELAIKTAKKNSTLVSFDVADPFVVERNRDRFADLIKNEADIVFANEEEAKLIYNTSPEEAAIKIAEGGATAVVKLGSKGAIVRKGSEQHKIDVVPTTVVDTTAAGDMFASGFLYGAITEKPLPECGKIAATLASDVISRIGASVSDKALAAVK